MEKLKTINAQLKKKNVHGNFTVYWSFGLSCTISIETGFVDF